MTQPSPARKRLIESTANMLVDKYTVRIWREEPELRNEYDNDDVWQIVRQCWSTLKRGELAELIAEMPRIRRVEVQDRASREGVVLEVAP